jgi:hypothetical protein
LSLNYSIAAADSGQHRAVGRQIREAGPEAFYICRARWLWLKIENHA